MNRRSSIFWGFLFIFIGGLAMVYNFTSPWFVWDFHWLPWRLWPILVITLGLSFITPPFFSGRRGLGGLFIPGVPIFATGCILLFNSLFNAWGAWAWLWPVVIVSLAVGFLLATWQLRVIWLLIPAIIIGANGLLMLFSAITGLWSIWAVFWSIEPFSVGLALLLVNIQKNSPGLLIAGLILCGIAGFATLGMSFIIPSAAWVNILGPSLILFVGFVLLISNLTRKKQPISVEV